MKIKKFQSYDTRSIEDIRYHYEIEKVLASALREASRDERKTAYSHLYDQLFKMVPNHPQLLGKTSNMERANEINRQMKLLSRFLSPDVTFLDLGAGDCKLSFSVAQIAAEVHAVDVSEQITDAAHTPSNFNLILSDGISVDVAPQSINLAYSWHLMEHLHPDDASDQLRNIYTALAPGGTYICATPHRFNGPHDVSRFFDRTATGFHLKEYTNIELYSLLQNAGFTNIRSILTIKGRSSFIPISLPILLEAALDRLPFRLKRTISTTPIFSNILGVCILGRKFASTL